MGDTFRSRSKVITRESISQFAELTGDKSRLHLDEQFARQTVFKSPISHGLLVLGISLGLWFSLDLNNDTIVAFAGINNLYFRAPIYPGDEVSLASEVISKRDSKSRPDSGIIV